MTCAGIGETSMEMQRESQAGKKTTLDLAKTFFAAKERHDLDSTMDLFAESAVYSFPLNASGDPAPWFRYEGKQAIAKYQQGVLTRFSQLHMVEQRFYESTDGETVFVECKGEYIACEGNISYNNVYVFRFTGSNGRLESVLEYANPVTFAKLAGLPIG